MEVLYAKEGLTAALQIARERRGTWFDPALVDIFLSFREDSQFWQSVGDDHLQTHVNRLEPADEIQIADEVGIDRVCSAFAQVVDAKSPWTYQHSQGVARIASGIACAMGMSQEMQRDIHRAGLLHDLGKLDLKRIFGLGWPIDTRKSCMYFPKTARPELCQPLGPRCRLPSTTGLHCMAKPT